MPLNYVQLSKTISRALRHDPAAYGLTLDEAGWVAVEDLLAALRSRRRAWHALSEADLRQMLASSNKQRYEITEGRIRAYYGHSIAQRIEKQPTAPPSQLYHGTSPQAAAIILREGLKPMNRQYVHLSSDIATANMVGGRHTAAPVLLIVEAERAYAEGIAFYAGNEDVWLAEAIPPQYIRQADDDPDAD